MTYITMRKEIIKLSEGGGGEAMHDLISRYILRNIKLRKTPGGIGLDEMDDGAVVKISGKNIVFTTDSYVVKPLFFKGGDIGKLSVNGTINDLSVMGAEPAALSLSLIITEGFSKKDLERIIKSVNDASGSAGIPIVTGDTKVIEGGRGGNAEMIINTAGIGIADRVIKDSGLKRGDVILINGGIWEHGIAILSEREGIGFDTEIKSDCCSLYPLISDITKSGIEIHAAKDPTRGGIANALNEMASKSNASITVYEENIPVRESVRTACEMLGIDPFETANEGKVLIGIAEKDAEKALKIMKRYDKRASIIGKVTVKGGSVVLETVIGGKRILRTPLGDPVPRVC